MEHLVYSHEWWQSLHEVSGLFRFHRWSLLCLACYAHYNSMKFIYITLISDKSVTSCIKWKCKSNQMGRMVHAHIQYILYKYVKWKCSGFSGSESISIKLYLKNHQRQYNGPVQIYCIIFIDVLMYTSLWCCCFRRFFCLYTDGCGLCFIPLGPIMSWLILPYSNT